jgi:hypothetical protein
MHYEDLELCRYHSGPLDTDSWHVPLRAIGWLESGHPYNRGPRPIALVEQINALVDNAERVFQQYHFRGFHDCTICELGDPAARLARSHINLLIPSKRTVFACPAAIVHYLSVHSYLPPSDFVIAVQDCPPYGSPQYFELLREANDGFPVPMVTWDEYLIEQRKVTDGLIRRRQTRLGTGPKE